VPNTAVFLPLYLSLNHADTGVEICNAGSAVENLYVEMLTIATITPGISTLRPLSLNPPHLS
jgi:hypothetical protein